MIVTLCLNPVIQKTLSFSKTIQVNSVNRAICHRFDASGKGVNVSRVLAQLGFSVVHITQIGGEFSSLFKKLCREDSINLDFVPVSTSIRFCYTLLDSAVTELVEEGYEVGKKVESKIHKKVNNYLLSSKTTALVISGSKAPGFSNDLFPAIVYNFLKRGIPVIADYRGEDLVNTLNAVKIIKDATVRLTIKPNAEELCSTFGCNNTENDIKECITSIYNDYGCNCIITQGEKPVLTYSKKGFFAYSIQQEINPINTTGCGDAFTAGFAGSISRSENFDNAVRYGLDCGAKNARTIRPGSIL